MNYRTARKVLVVGTTATYTDIKQSFREKAKQVHPDQYAGKDSVAEIRFAALNEAYRFLMTHRSPFQRERYRINRSRMRFALCRMED